MLVLYRGAVKKRTSASRKFCMKRRYPLLVTSSLRMFDKLKSTYSGVTHGCVGCKKPQQMPHRQIRSGLLWDKKREYLAVLLCPQIIVLYGYCNYLLTRQKALGSKTVMCSVRQSLAAGRGEHYRYCDCRFQHSKCQFPIWPVAVSSVSCMWMRGRSDVLRYHPNV